MLRSPSAPVFALFAALLLAGCQEPPPPPDPDAEVEARKREALVMIALYALPFEAHKPLWDTLDVGYFMRHDAADIAWHTRHLSRVVGSDKPVVRARRSPVPALRPEPATRTLHSRHRQSASLPRARLRQRTLGIAAPSQPAAQACPRASRRFDAAHQ